MAVRAGSCFRAGRGRGKQREGGAEGGRREYDGSKNHMERRTWVGDTQRERDGGVAQNRIISY